MKIGKMKRKGKEETDTTGRTKGGVCLCDRVLLLAKSGIQILLQIGDFSHVKLILCSRRWPVAFLVKATLFYNAKTIGKDISGHPIP